MKSHYFRRESVWFISFRECCIRFSLQPVESIVLIANRLQILLMDPCPLCGSSSAVCRQTVHENETGWFFAREKNCKL